MLEVLSSLLDPKNDYTKILTFVLIYLVALWVIFCLWVFVDAQKRYKNVFLAVIFFLLVLILNFPILIFYLIIRPEREEDNVLYLQSGDETVGAGVNVPVVNFVGNDGVEMSLFIRVSKPSEALNPDMKVNVDFVSNNANFKKEEKKVVKVEEIGSVKKSDVQFAENFKQMFKSKANGVKNAAKNVTSKFKKKEAPKVEEKKEEQKIVEAPAAAVVEN